MYIELWDMMATVLIGAPLIQIKYFFFIAGTENVSIYLNTNMIPP